MPSARPSRQVHALTSVCSAHACAGILVIAYFALSAYWDYWHGDDVFFYLRYAQNLASGHGLVYNPGEYYETNTNFLWSVLLAFPFVASIDPFLFVEVASNLVSCAVLVLVYLVANRLTDRYTALLAMLLVATHWTFFLIVHSGFMPHLVGLLALTAIYSAMNYARNPGGGNALAIGISLSLLSITRLDAQLPFIAILCLTAWLIYRHSSRKILHTLLACILPIVLFAVYLLCKYLYYGDILPASYYAKIGSRVPEEFGFARRGLFYNWLYLWRYALLPFIFVAVLLAVHRVRKMGFAKLRSSLGFQVFVACIAIVFLQFAYMLRSGGGVIDFRFHVPTAPFLFILLMQGMWHERKIAMISAVALINASLIYATAEQEGTEGLAYPIGIANMEKQVLGANQAIQNAKKIASVFSELPPYHKGIKIASAVGGHIPFYLRVHAIEMYGWADTRIQEKGNHIVNRHHPKPGHHIIANPHFLLKEGVNIIFGNNALLPKDWRQRHDLQNIVAWLSLMGGYTQYYKFPDDAKILEFPMSDDSVLLAIYAIRTEELDKLLASKNVKMHDLQ